MPGAVYCLDGGTGVKWAKFFVLLVLICFSIFTTRVSASFAVYYGQIGPSEFPELDSFDIIILSPTVNSTYVSELSANHTVVGYVSLATIGGWEPWAKNLPEGLLIGENQNWDEGVVDFSSPEWERIILEEAVPYILSQGFDGVFLDNLDYVDLYPEKKDAMVNLVRAIRERYPDITIIANRGFSIAEEIAPYVDYVLLEDFVTYYNFSIDRYEVFDDSELQWEFDQIQKLKSLNISILALSYADLTNESQVREFSALICMYAEEYNISEVYLADLSLQRIGFDPCERQRVGTRTIQEGTPQETSSEENEEAVCGPVIFLPLILLGRFILR
ncbi:hypothetical protein E3E27_02640 [Thermococcus sp. MV11]|nr:endo alpha-1,4 polygalactosaminidase [Thermococcus sp. MV11]NJE03042.1 hypothetical protein [Thermococcus sp. MV11]